MSGGRYDYSYFKLDQLADDIERDFLNDGKYMGEDWGSDPEFPYMKRNLIEYDRLEEATEEQKKLILAEVRSLIIDLRKCSKRAKEIEWFLSGDTGPTSYLERLKGIE